MKRSEIVSYITWGILLLVAGIVIIFVKAITGFFLFYWLLGAILILVGLAYIKKKTFLGVVLVLLGILTLLGKLTKTFTVLLSLVGWIALVVGIILILVGFVQVKKRV